MSEHNHKRDINSKVAFMISRSPGHIPTVFFGMPEGAWDYMKEDGMSHDFDLTKAGIPVKLVIFRGTTHDAIVKRYHEMASAAGVSVLDQRNKDFKIDGLPRK